MLFTYADQVMSWYVNGREQELSRLFLDKGYEGLKSELNVQKEAEWEIIKDNFVIYSGLVVMLVVKNIEFFVDILMNKGSAKVRAILGITNEKYDEVWAVLMDAMLDGFAKRKFREKRLEHASYVLDEIIQVLDSYDV
ncbi:MAG: hypothetical protein ABH856_00310 [Patescibacteria group bacterium]|nr:hypothetical protein [Patescibacteria group bacterium]